MQGGTSTVLDPVQCSKPLDPALYWFSPRLYRYRMLNTLFASNHWAFRNQNTGVILTFTRCIDTIHIHNQLNRPTRNVAFSIFHNIHELNLSRRTSEVENLSSSWHRHCVTLKISHLKLPGRTHSDLLGFRAPPPPAPWLISELIKIKLWALDIVCSVICRLFMYRREWANKPPIDAIQPKPAPKIQLIKSILLCVRAFIISGIFNFSPIPLLAHPKMIIDVVSIHRLPVARTIEMIRPFLKIKVAHWWCSMLLPE